MDRIAKKNKEKKDIKKGTGGLLVRRFFLYEENHSLGEWLKRSLMAMM